MALVDRVIPAAADPWTEVDNVDAVEHVLANRRKSDPYLWLRLVEPDNAQLERLGRVLSLDPVIVRDLQSGQQSPRLQRMGEHLYAAVWDLPDDDQSIASLVTVTVLAGSGWLVTLRSANGTEASNLVDALRDATPPAESPLTAALAVLTEVARRYATRAAQLETSLERLEEDVFNPGIVENVQHVYEVRRSIGRLDRAVSGLAAALESAEHDLAGLVDSDPPLEPYLRHLTDDIAGTAGVMKDQAKALDAAVSSHESNVSMRQNRDMRTVSTVAALFAFPTVISGLYGMNLPDIPLGNTPQGWAMVAGGAILLDAIAFMIFKHRHWV